MAARFTNSAQESLQQAQAEAIRRDHQELTPEHLLFSLIENLDEEKGVVPNLLQLAGVNLPALRSRVDDLLEKLPRVSGGSGQIYSSPSLNRLLVLAEDEAKKLSDEYISGEHFLLALLSGKLKDTKASEALVASGLKRDTLLSAMKQIRGDEKITDAEPEGKY